VPYYYEKTGHELKNIEGRIEAAIFQPIATLKAQVWVTPEPVPFKERTSGQAAEIAVGQTWAKLWDCGWFHFTGQVPAEARGKKVALLVDLSGEGLVVADDGTPLQGLTTVSSEFDLSLGRPGKRVIEYLDKAKGGETVDFWVEAGMNDLFGRYQDSGILKEASVAICNPTMRQLWYDFSVLRELAEQLPADTARKAQIVAALHSVGNLLFDYTEEEAAQARECLAKELAKTGGTPSLSLTATGHAHIDLAWLWPVRETIRKAGRTFSTVLRMMERYPDYIFGGSQPQLYQWTKDYYPALFEQIKKRVAEGRWELQGGMWVEADTNVSGGEALVRQLLYGKRFFQENFGKTMEMLWLPDVFGYNASIPQLLKKSGVNYFLTIKLSWNTFNVFPHHTFMWEGIDGSQVLTHLPPEGTYNSSAAPRAIVASEKTFQDKYVSDKAVLLFGIGDGGGGPGEEHLERLAREKNLAGLAPVKQGHAIDFFHEIEKDQANYKTWRGELYLEKHQGTFTTQGRNKWFNRKLELAFRELELYASLAHNLAGKDYPGEELINIWREFLLYQFHDILPGSSITRVYDESRARYAALLERIQTLTGEAKAAWASTLNTGTVKQPVLLTNSLSWPRQEWVNIKGSWRNVEIPALGYTVADLGESAASIPADGLAASAESLENDKIRVSFAKDGSINSIFDKEAGREVVAAGGAGNKLTLYEDKGDAWDFAYGYEDKAIAGGVKLAETNAYLDGPQAVVEQIYYTRDNRSKISQKIVLTLGSARLDFVTEADWHERERMLRTSFKTNVRSQAAACNIQYGTLMRPTHQNTSWDMARNEIPAQKWIDLSDGGYGVALLNDSKYGYRVDQDVLDLDLLRSPLFPDPEADQGQHTFTYSLFPHTGDYTTGGVVRAGYELNVPVSVAEVPARSGKGAATGGYFAGVPENVVIEAVKKAEDSDALVVRLYETWGRPISATLQPGFAFRQATLTNLMEEDIEDLKVEGGQLTLNFGPFEIHTVKMA